MVVIGACVFLWLMLIQISFTGLIVYDDSITDSDEYPVMSKDASLFSQVNSVLMVTLLLAALGILHKRMKKRSHSKIL